MVLTPKWNWVVRSSISEDWCGEFPLPCGYKNVRKQWKLNVEILVLITQFRVRKMQAVNLKTVTKTTLKFFMFVQYFLVNFKQWKCYEYEPQYYLLYLIQNYASLVLIVSMKNCTCVWRIISHASHRCISPNSRAIIC